MSDLTGYDVCWQTEGSAVESIAEGAQKLSGGTTSLRYRGPAAGENHEYEFTVYAIKADGTIIADGTITGWYPAKPESAPSSGDSSGGGCSTGFGALALLALMPVVLRKKDNR